MAAVDDAARAHGRTTFRLDTFAHQDTRRLYETRVCYKPVSSERRPRVAAEK